MISTLPAGNLSSECSLYNVSANYYTWHRANSDNTQHIWVKRVDESGSAFTGWDADGIKASSYNDPEAIQLLPVARLTSNGLFVMWKDMRGDWIPNYWGQLISPAGQRMWASEGQNLSDRQNEQERPAITSTASGITFAWCENINGWHDIAAQKYSYTGTPLWGDLGYYVVQKDSTQANPTIASFTNEQSIVAWTDFLGIESDIYFKYMNSDGTFVGDPMGTILCNAAKPQYDPLAAVMNNEAYVVWADGRSSGKTEILGLYAQKLSSGVANNDPSTPSLDNAVLDQNYPNPFNPTTTISFSLKQSCPQVTLQVFNLKGQLVNTLYSGNLAAGQHSIVWDGKDNNNDGVASGMYFYRLNTGYITYQRKMLLM